MNRFNRFAEQPIACLLLALVVWTSNASLLHGGVIWTYRGLDWMIDASSDIVVATEVPPAPQKNYDATGKPIITGLPDVQNGVKWKIVIQHVIKGDLEVGEHIDIFLPATSYIGKIVGLLNTVCSRNGGFRCS